MCSQRAKWAQVFRLWSRGVCHEKNRRLGVSVGMKIVHMYRFHDDKWVHWLIELLVVSLPINNVMAFFQWATTLEFCFKCGKNCMASMASTCWQHKRTNERECNWFFEKVRPFMQARVVGPPIFTTRPCALNTRVWTHTAGFQDLQPCRGTGSALSGSQVRRWNLGGRR